MIRPRLVFVTNSVNGGVWSVVQFLRTVVERSGEYDYDIITLATSSKDKDSLRLVSPSTWFGSPRMTERRIDGLTTHHVGAILTEFEFQRYKPRRILTDLLNQYDLIQIVGGSPACGEVAQQVQPPICLFAATTSAIERDSELRTSNPLLHVWRRQMTRFATRAEDRALAIATPSLPKVRTLSVFSLERPGQTLCSSVHLALTLTFSVRVLLFLCPALSSALDAFRTREKTFGCCFKPMLC